MKRASLLLAIILLFAACDNTGTNVPSEDNGRPSIAVESNRAMAAYQVADAKVMMRESNVEQKIIRTASLRYEVNDMKMAMSDIKNLLINYKGEVENEHQYSQPDRLNSSITVRVPAVNFESFIQELLQGESIRRLDERSISARDVTEQFIDVEARLKTKKQTMDRYRELLQRAESVSDIINIEDKIRRLQEEIESQEARLKYLSEQVAMSEVRINIYEITKTTYVPDKSNGLLPTILKALHGGLKGLAIVLLWIIKLWPVWLMYIIIRLIVKLRKKVK